MGRFTPTVKAPEIDAALKSMTGVDRVAVINNDLCAFCKNPALEFRGVDGCHEYRISGLCQTCQDQVFGTSPGGSE